MISMNHYRLKKVDAFLRSGEDGVHPRRSENKDIHRNMVAVPTKSNS